jgi:Fe-S oxidoreductase
MEAGLSSQLRKLFETRLNGTMRMYLDSCARCGLCVESCHVYASMPEMKYSAVGRAEVVRKIFRRYFRMQGKFAPWLGEVLEFDDCTLDMLNEAAFSCTGCRRCMVHCPFGIDTQQIMGIAKALLIGADRSQEILSMLADMSVAKGEGIEDTKESFKEAVGNLDAEVRALWPASPAPSIPVEAAGAKVLYVALAGKHSIVPAAAIMNAAGESWTLSYFEAVNFAAFLGDGPRMKIIAGRIFAEAEKLGVKEIAVVECGTAFRVLRHFMPQDRFKVVTFVELIDRYIREGRIKLNRGTIAGWVTYHDPCQIARNSGIFEEPRRVLSALTPNFREMTPTREENWCCGGGGGLVAIGDDEFRMKSSRVKAEQMAACGAGMVTTACENCHSQLTDINAHYGLGLRVEFISKLVADALVKP